MRTKLSLFLLLSCITVAGTTILTLNNYVQLEILGWSVWMLNLWIFYAIGVFIHNKLSERNRAVPKLLDSELGILDA